MDEGTLEKLLHNYFGYEQFREGQREIIEDLLKGNDVLGILPTGTGKSMCYQLPSLLLEGTVIVVSPLISLMIDQVKQLKQQGMKRVVAVNSFLNPQQKQQVYTHIDQYKLVYCSPEMLQNDQFLQVLKEKVSVSLLVVDEAHCISQWGHEFRTDYLKLDETLKELKEPTVLALSATAPVHVQDDIVKQMDRPDMRKHIYPMDRENIAFTVEHVAGMEEKIQRLAAILNTHSVPTMIYFSSRQWTEKAAHELNQRVEGMRIAYYHGGMDQVDRLLIQQQFMNNQLDVICCTSAFGMGVNKGNIRLVVHAHIPSQVESFLQEIGRAGRDGLQSVSLTLYSPGDGEIPKRFIETELPSEEMVSNAMRYLQSLSNKGMYIPTRPEDIEETLQLSEVQWRFLSYQFEKHGLTKGKNILKHQGWKEAYYSILTFIQERTVIKQNKLAELLHWVHSEKCLRSTLYSSFQASLKEPTGFCCDRCDFAFDLWTTSNTDKRTELLNWEEELQKIFLQGGSE
ncbi:ATP-dependent DNA helicase RecQ [Pontibacillus sp. ALD_SL1]|uniref:RecQ family ATP-dependent DNA helicase n=1 Tax=Pontibacillus sp. ALD_SL1 TaxID=2777185 RepID=UPI001A971A5F|nr:ATP-dependent DNA helicase RecQ [Pontibacillus sp. ALD_SL1]QSS98502.1 ATP-dependent DNA helicase RecQ [Pontibacillus sp. ALD_SL1]